MSEATKSARDCHNDFKYRDYAKHISWVYHKTQVLPKVMLLGENSESVPLRNYKLRNCELTRLDALPDAPTAKDLFVDYAQRVNFKDHTLRELTTDPKLRAQYLGTQNVAIIDDVAHTSSSERLIDLILRTEPFLTTHGRFLFDIPVNDSSIAFFGRAYFNHDFHEITAIPKKIISMVRLLNDKLKGTNTHFKIEEIKLSLYGDAVSIAGIVVYLKKEDWLSSDAQLD